MCLTGVKKQGTEKQLGASGGPQAHTCLLKQPQQAEIHLPMVASASQMCTYVMDKLEHGSVSNDPEDVVARPGWEAQVLGKNPS